MLIILYMGCGSLHRQRLHRQMTSPTDDFTDRDLTDKKISYNEL
jgi:hypothetical protein